MKLRFLLFCIFVCLPTLTSAVESTGWYGFVGKDKDSFQCEAMQEITGPLAYMRLAERNGWAYQMQDVEENGKLVETTLLAPESEIAGGRITWYRTKERCEGALSKYRKERELEKQQEQQTIQRYR